VLLYEELVVKFDLVLTMYSTCYLNHHEMFGTLEPGKYFDRENISVLSYVVCLFSVCRTNHQAVAVGRLTTWSILRNSTKQM